jgi:hypothetical protein
MTRRPEGRRTRALDRFDQQAVSLVRHASPDQKPPVAQERFAVTIKQFIEESLLGDRTVAYLLRFNKDTVYGRSARSSRRYYCAPPVRVVGVKRFAMCLRSKCAST